MSNKTLLGAKDIAEILDMSVPYCYKVIKKLNEQLQNDGFMVISGKISRVYFEEQFYGLQPKGGGANASI